MKKTKIIATIGPASWDVEMLIELAKNGMDIARINFSHGDPKSLEPIIKNIVKANKKLKKKIKVLQDLSGPKIRTGNFKGGEITLRKGCKTVVVSKNIIGTEKKFSISYPDLFAGLKIGDRIFLNDGRQELEILEHRGDELLTVVLAGGKMKSKRGVNLPDSNLTVSSLTEKDIADLKFSEKWQPDYIALSFVKSADSIKELRKILRAKKIKSKIIAKIETKSAVKNIDEIIDATDLIMIARGDLGVEVGLEKVPAIQKRIINKCNRLSIPEIVATQMLESMVESPVPTRAEVTDVDAAVIHGADIVMMSAETATGEYPLEALQMMVKIIKESENYI